MRIPQSSTAKATRISAMVSFALCAIIGIAVAPCNGFLNGGTITRGGYFLARSHATIRDGSFLQMVAAVPPRSHVRTPNKQHNFKSRGRSNRSGSYSSPPGNNNNSSRQRSRYSGRSEDDAAARWKRALQVEEQLVKSLDAMRHGIRNVGNDPHAAASFVRFPSVRDCNAALATFGDGGHLLRALRLFVKMRKAASLEQYFGKSRVFWNPIPAPTLVTYSTLMSRAVQAGKPHVALRLWRLMTMQAEFFASANSVVRNPTQATPSSRSDVNVTTSIVPDVKAANILMNAYAKLADFESAQDLLSQMLYGNGTDVPRMTPNLVTYNTLLDACHKAGELDHALTAKQQLDDSGLIPDARTYTSLIATVARKASIASGANDPTMAFVLLHEMTTRGVRPNGMTYCALIDVCGRCRRSDLALKGLRIMLRQKTKEQKEMGRAVTSQKKYALSNEVGAWTAAINACGKAGRLDTAVRLFYAMPNFGVKPNTITCGCLTDCLLRNSRTGETLDVLRYMKREGIPPSEVMYTSLMTSAGKLVQAENRKQWADERKVRQNQSQEVIGDTESEESDDDSEARAIEVYTELMTTLMRGPADGQAPASRNWRWRNHQTQRSHNPRNKPGGAVNDSNTLLLKVFLVFQEMKAAGAQPDLACYNALLRACARAGDVSRAQNVLNQIRQDGLVPNDTTWRETIRAAGKIRRSDLAESIWKSALHFTGSDEEPQTRWKPSVVSFGALIHAYLRHASSLDYQRDYKLKKKLLEKVVSLYLLTKSCTDEQQDERRISCPVKRESLHESQRTMLLILRAVVSLEAIYATNGTRKEVKQSSSLRDLARSIVSLDCFQEEEGGLATPVQHDVATWKALNRARNWLVNGNA